ncbi:MAG: radical SAM protein [Candidatus Erginobacter occultus]|nr:radical SAM protein [Candidatus Erginobacter occultus]
MNDRGDNTVLTRILDRGRRERLPLHGSIELTRRCALLCPHCYLGFARNDPPESELSGEGLFGLFDQFRAEGCLFLTFTGGEPLLREDFREIYLGALRRGFLVNLFTSGTTLDRALADFLSRYPPLHVDITIFGATEKIGDRITGKPGSFRRGRKAVALLAERGIAFGLKTVVNALNRGEVEGMKQFARLYGKTLRFDSLITPRLDGSRDNLRYRLDPREVIRLDREDEVKWREWRDYACRPGELADRGLLYGCGAGLHSFHVTSAGELRLCVLDTNYSFNLKKGSFREGWREFIPRIRALRTGEDNRCADCDLRPLCTSCPAWARLETGDAEKPVDFLCQVAGFRGILRREEEKKNLPEA